MAAVMTHQTHRDVLQFRNLWLSFRSEASTRTLTLLLAIWISDRPFRLTVKWRKARESRATADSRNMPSLLSQRTQYEEKSSRPSRKSWGLIRTRYRRRRRSN